MTDVQQIAAEIVAREGGFVNDPDDPGGATNYGVTIHTMRRLGLDLDHDGDVDVADVRALPRDEAVEIFIDHYFHKPRIDELPAQLNYYFRLADRRPASRKYAMTRAGGKGGWIRRAEEFISPRYHMSDAAFRERVAQWA